jgi:hypothetical protein
MRDNHAGMPEIVDALDENGNFFAVVQLERGGETKRFRFGISRNGYSALRHTLQLRPFDQAAGAQYRYFFVSRVRRTEGDRVMMTVRVEQGRDGKQFEVESPRDVVANLMWFWELKDWNQAQHLAVAG